MQTKRPMPSAQALSQNAYDDSLHVFWRQHMWRLLVNQLRDNRPTDVKYVLDWTPKRFIFVKIVRQAEPERLQLIPFGRLDTIPRQWYGYIFFSITKPLRSLCWF